MTDNVGRVKVLALLGPTAVGKSALALELARRLGCDIVSCDSRQVYRGMDIGTAKPSVADRRSVTHHLVDTITPDRQWSAFDFAAEAGRVIRGLHGRGRRALVCGGTGFYFRALLEGARHTGAADGELRQQLSERVAREGPMGVFCELKAVNPAAARRLHPNDTRRVIRALEIHHATGRSAAGLNERAQPANAFDCCVVIASRPRQVLYDRINERVDAMVREGLWEEFRALRRAGYTAESPGMLCLGYRELFAVESGSMSLNEAVEAVKTHTRQYAKRQLTWFRHQCVGRWVEAGQHDTLEQILDVYGVFL